MRIVANSSKVNKRDAEATLQKVYCNIVRSLKVHDTSVKQSQSPSCYFPYPDSQRGNCFCARSRKASEVKFIPKTSIPLSHNSVQSHNSVLFLLYTCLTSLIKDSRSLHSTLVVKSELCGKIGF